jgi:hypothetical protein
MSKVSFFGRLARGAQKVVGAGGDLGKWTAKAGVAPNRMQHLDDAGVFAGNAVKKGDNTNIALRVLSDQESLIDDVISGKKSSKEVKAVLMGKFADEGWTGGKTSMDNFLTPMLSESQKFARNAKVLSRLGSASGKLAATGLIVGSAYLIVNEMLTMFSIALGGMLDPLLNLTANSDVGVAIVVGSVVIGSVYILKMTRDALGS